MTDIELLALMMAGDEEAFVTLYRRRQGAVYRFALQMSGSAATAEEVTQEVFMTLIREPRQFDPGRGSLAAYLYGIGRKHVLRRLEKDRPYLLIEDEDLASQEDTLGDLTRREGIDSVRRAVLSLPATYREAVVLCDLHEMSYEQAAGVLGCAIGTGRGYIAGGRCWQTNWPACNRSAMRRGVSHEQPGS